MSGGEKGESRMRLGVVGLGRMGANIVRRLTRQGHQCVVFDQNPAAIEALAGQTLAGQTVAGGADLRDLVRRLDRPRVVWVMLPSGEITEQAVVQLGDMLQSGDIIIDGGNSFYKDDVRRAKTLKAKGIRYVDCGTSGGVWGLERGYCLMIGGDKEAVDYLDPIFNALAPWQGDIPRTPQRERRDPRVERGSSIAVPAAPGALSKWCTTASSTA
jgi:6-phosphogluconate dehydrogenase